MCGLVGIAGDTNGAWRDLFTELLLFDVLRGPHSTGAGFVGRHTEDFGLAKRVGHPFNLIQSSEYDSLLESKQTNKVLMGHNRYATIGEKTEENAHPFAFKNVLGMHNGTLDKWIVRDLKDHDKFGTDSEAIFNTISATSLEETLKVMSGAWALVYFDKRDHTLNFLRNDRRPLHYCYSDDRCTLIWSSEVELIKYLMGRRGKKVLNDEYFTTTKDIHYSWKVPSASNKKFDAPHQQLVEGKKYTYTTNNYTPSFMGGSKASGSTTTQTSGTNHVIGPAQIISFADRLKTHKFRPPYKDPYGKVISKLLFQHITEEGCVFCNEHGQKWGEFIHLMSAYTGKHTPYVCESCFNDPDLYDYTQYAI